MAFNSTVIPATRLAADPEAYRQAQPERRTGGRWRRLYRIAHVQTPDDDEPARILNISDEDLGLQLLVPVMLGDAVALRLNAEVVIEGRVAWTRGGDCELQLNDPIDSEALLREIAARSRSTASPPLRIPVGKPAVARSEPGLRGIRIEDASQNGMKGAHDGSFAAGLQVKVSLSPGIERRGVVRWSRGDIAGRILLEPLRLPEPGSTMDL